MSNLSLFEAADPDPARDGSAVAAPSAPSASRVEYLAGLLSGWSLDGKASASQRERFIALAEGVLIEAVREGRHP